MKKKSAFEKYISRWGLDKYRFLFVNKKEVWVYPIPQYGKAIANNREIKDINTFIKKSLNTFILVENGHNTEILTLSELKQRALVEKLSGL